MLRTFEDLKRNVRYLLSKMSQDQRNIDNLEQQVNEVSDEVADSNSQISSNTTQITSTIGEVDTLKITSANLQQKSFDKVVVVKQASDLLGALSSDVIYLVDGNIDMLNNSIVVPPGGLFIQGHDYFVSSLFSSSDNTTLFVNDGGNPSGNFRVVNLTLYVTGLNSKMFNLDNQGNFASIEFLSTNLGTFSGETTSLGDITNYRQFRTDDVAFIRVADGMNFNGVWAGGFAITRTILLSIPANTVVFKEGNSLDFEGSSISDINAISIDNSVVVFEFQESNFQRDEGFALAGARFNINSNPVPNISLQSTKRFFKDCSGVENTFPGGQWELTAEILTPLTQNVSSKILGTTTYENLVYFIQNTDNEFVYNSEISKSFNLFGYVVIDGAANAELELEIRKWDSVNSNYIIERVFKRRVSNVIGGLDVAYFIISATTVLSKNDRIELWIKNTTSGADITALDSSYLRLDTRFS